MLSKSLIQFSVDGLSCVPSLLFTLGPNYGGNNEDNGDLPENIPGMYCHSPCPQPCSRPPPTHTFTRDSWTPTGESTEGSLPFSCVLGHKVLMCPPRVYFPVLCKFWQLYSRVNGNLLQEDLYHTHTQSPCPCSRPLQACTSPGDTQTQFCLSLCGVPGSWCTQGLFETPELIKKQRHYFAKKGPSSQSYGFSSSHVWM